ncbi:MAG TPA: hypothetical protein VN081_00655 [Dongiaceae bacterium]|nr:hypothetical protein [Dongiaceae bacterium]
MDIFLKSARRRFRHVVTTTAVLLAVIAPGVLPAFVSADTVTGRSVELSSSSKGATGVTYTVGFTPVQSGGAFVVLFCENSPIIGDTCTSPSTSHGFSASSAASTTSGFTDVTGSTNSFVVAGTLTAATPVSVAVTGINNPTVAEQLYARIVTFDNKTDALAYPGATTGMLDSGGVALSITDTIGVSGQVQESMQFCVSKNTISADCAGTVAPTLALGETVGSSVALVPTAVSTGSIYAQISTNAESGAIVSLKSSALGCGGLMRAGAPTKCDIAPAGASGGISAGTAAKFGVMAIAAADTGASPNGAFVAMNGYNASTYVLNYTSGDTAGVTSPYGDQILTTSGAPANNKNMQLQFGATVTNSTPAGSYSADLSLIATGKF